MASLPSEKMKELIGGRIGTSEWILIDQAMIDKFADAGYLVREMTLVRDGKPVAE